jgi:hypothetical protein
MSVLSSRHDEKEERMNTIFAVPRAAQRTERVPAACRIPAAALALLLTAGISLSGCKANKPAVSDDALTTTIQNQLSADSAIAGQQVTVSVQNGVATLNGVVSNDAQRTIAARDAAGVPGVQQVRNAIVVGVLNASVNTPPPAPVPLKPAPAIPPAETRRELQRDRDRNGERDRNHSAAPIERENPPMQQQAAAPAPTPAPVQQAAPPPPPPPPQPVFKSVTIPAGDTLPVRVTQTLDSATTQQGEAFSGVIASDIVIDGVTAIPAGANVSGQVDEVHEAAHFKGSSLLTVSLNSVTRKGDRISITTDPYTVQGKGRGGNTAEKAGIGAVGGAILGGILGGGKGAAIGAAAGGGTGAGINAVTRGQQVQIPSETIVRFKLTTPVTVRVRVDHDDHDDHGDRHPIQ